MNIEIKKDVKVVIALNEREAKLLVCLFGAMAPKDALDLVTTQSVDAGRLGVKDATQRELTDFTGELYEGLFRAL